MSETTAEYNINQEDLNLSKHIEQKCILDSFNRLHPIIESMAQKANPDESHYMRYMEKYIELERLSLDLARYALDYLIAQGSNS